MNLEDVTKSVIHTINERVASPLTGAFALSWIAWNYKAVLVLLSTKSVEDKIIFLEFLIYDGDRPYLQLMVWPLLTAASLIAFYPLLSLGGYWVWAAWQKKFRAIQEDLEKGRLVSREELEEWRSSASEAFGRSAREIEQKNAAIKALQESEKEKNAYIDKLHDDLSRVASQAGSSVDTTPIEKRNTDRLLRSTFRMIFNPRSGSNGTKDMLFGPDGMILEGRNKNENKWRVQGAFLELITADDLVHNRFVWHPAEEAFIATDDDQLPAIKGQRLIPKSTSSAFE